MTKAVKKAIDIVLIVVIVALFIFGAFILTIAVTKKEGVSKVFGVALLDIQTDSMKAKAPKGLKGNISKGDMVITKQPKSATDIAVGDIITYWDLVDLNGDGKEQAALITHRVVEIVVETADNGEKMYLYITKGDANAKNDDRAKVFNDIEGKYSFKIANFGYVTRFLMSGWGFFLIIVLPLGAFLGYRIYVLAKVVFDMKREKLTDDQDQLKAELEKLRAQVAGMNSELTDIETQIIAQTETVETIAQIVTATSAETATQTEKTKQTVQAVQTETIEIVAQTEIVEPAEIIAPTPAVTAAQTETITPIIVKTETKPKTATKAADTKPKATTKAADTKPKTATKVTDTKPKTVTKAADTKPKATTKAADTKPKATTKAADTKPKATTKTTDTKPKATTQKSKLDDKDKNGNQ